MSIRFRYTAILLLMIAVLAGGGFWYYRSHTVASPKPPPHYAASTNVNNTPPSTITEDQFAAIMASRSPGVRSRYTTFAKHPPIIKHLAAVCKCPVVDMVYPITLHDVPVWDTVLPTSPYPDLGTSFALGDTSLVADDGGITGGGSGYYSPPGVIGIPPTIVTAVPELSSWLYLVIGFGLIGYALRITNRPFSGKIHD